MPVAGEHAPVVCGPCGVEQAMRETSDVSAARPGPPAVVLVAGTRRERATVPGRLSLRGA